MEIKVVEDDITKLDAEAIVNPANSKLTMGGGLAGIIRKKGGEAIQKEAKVKAPVKVGEATVTTAGNLPSRYVIHAPTMENPAQKVSAKNARLAMKGILKTAEQNNIKEVAVPGLGTGVGGVPYEEAAKVMVDEAKKFEGKNLKKIIFVGYEESLYEAFRSALSS